MCITGALNYEVLILIIGITMNERNQEIKRYICSLFGQEPDFILQAKLRSKQEGLPNIHISEKIGKFLSLLIALKNPQRVLEIGTLGAYSTLWLAKNLRPDAHIITLEYYPHHAQAAKKSIERANLPQTIEVREGDACQLLPQMQKDGEGPFDFLFIDADKDKYPEYLKWAIELAKPGSLIVSDNLIPKRGRLGYPDPDDPNAQGIHTFNTLIATHPKLDSTITPIIVGENGRVDGLGISYVKP